MTCIKNRSNFPYILQQDPLWCILASIENVMKYHRPTTNITQTQIFQQYTAQNPFNTISFNRISQVLRTNYSQYWNFDPRQWQTNNQFVDYVENCIRNNNPVIISMRLPGRTGAHMFTVLCINSRFFRIFDTGYLPTWINLDKNFILNNLSPQRGTLLITPI
jgi:hypothetical protein